mmetsp:Transcript_75110/g.147440  ORF Transcript_75110/g.147440 Transcript_75110/m.147440 type:complete len:108 (+) Transcript_75110:1188-1511(+)
MSSSPILIIATLPAPLPIPISIPNPTSRSPCSITVMMLCCSAIKQHSSALHTLERFNTCVHTIQANLPTHCHYHTNLKLSQQSQQSPQSQLSQLFLMQNINMATNHN